MSRDISVVMNLFAYCNNDAVNNSDPTGHWAIAVCADFAVAAIYGCYFNIGVCFDGKGNIGIFVTVGMSIVTNMYASISIGVSWYPRYKSIFDLKGVSFTRGGAYTWGAYVSVNGSINISVDGVFSPHVTISAGRSVSKAPFHIETRAGYTKIIAKTTIKRLCQSLKRHSIYRYYIGRYRIYIQRDRNNIITISSPLSRKKLLIYTKNNRIRFL